MNTNNMLKELYDKLNEMTTSEFAELIKAADTDDEREFYYSLFDIVLQQRQKKVIWENSHRKKV